METKQLFQCRKSVRSYTGTLSEEALHQVLDAAQLSPVGMGKFESLHLTVIQCRNLLDELDKNAGLAFGDASRHVLYGAPCLILVSTPIGDPNMANVSYSNAAIMADNMSLAAIDLGLGSCLIWGAIRALNANPDLVAKLGLPAGFVPCCGVVIGDTAETFEAKPVPTDRIAVDYIK